LLVEFGRELVCFRDGKTQLAQQIEITPDDFAGMRDSVEFGEGSQPERVENWRFFSRNGATAQRKTILEPEVFRCVVAPLREKFPLNFDIVNFKCVQALQQLNHFSVVKFRIVRLDRQKEPVARRHRKIRQIENRVIRLR